MKSLLKNNRLILMEAAIVERLRRAEGIKLHETLVNAPLIYEDVGQREMRKIYQSYIDIALKAGIPFFMCTPTWRTNQERVLDAKVTDTINYDAVKFMKEIRDSIKTPHAIIKIGGLIGCKNDCYKPEEGLSAVESEKFHSWQIKQLAEAGVDFLIAETLPNIEEAKGIAKAMEVTGIPYIISFVISRNGCLLDGTDLGDAVKMIDSATQRNPLGFSINCAYPTFLCASKQPARVLNRLIGYFANASSLDHDLLDGADTLEVDDLSEWGESMIMLNKIYGVKVLGGCCGTDDRYLQYIVRKYNEVSP